jgi:putative tricarboxylic transport membrane protein
MRKLAEEMIAHAVLLVFLAVLFWESRSFPEMNIGGKLGASWWPRITIGLGMTLTVASAALVARKCLQEPELSGVIKAKELKTLGISSAIFMVFLLLLGSVGFLGALPVLMFGFVYQLGARNWRTLTLVPILASPIFAFIFGRLMEVPLPRGVGWVRIFSFYIY